jgi:RNA polymerase sigma-54 factor
LTAEASGEDDDSAPPWENSLTKKTSLEDHLLWQLRLSKPTELGSSIGVCIIQNLDENGYLTLTVDEVCAAMQSTPEALEAVLKRIQYFDPVGVAARDLRECLLVQLDNSGLSDSLAAKIVGNYLNSLESMRHERLAKDLNVTIVEVAEAAHLIASLERMPSRGFYRDNVRK